MGNVAIITMVQAADLPHALSSLASAARARRSGDLHLVLLNDEPDDALIKKLEAASGGEVLSAPRNLGVAGGRNRLIREAIRRGAEFVASIDDDILVPPDFIEILNAEYATLAAQGENPGILTPATLDYHSIGETLYSSEAAEKIGKGEPVDTPQTAAIRAMLGAGGKRRARDIYHMGIADWRGAYFYSGTPGDHAIQRAYSVEPPRLSGAEAHLRHSKHAWSWIIEGDSPKPIDTAPGGICFYATALADEIGFHDESFNPFGFEDADFALRARKSGRQHYCAPRAIAIHDIAARLSERPVAVLRASQGKMAGAFVRKHAQDHEAAAAFAAITRRTIEQVTLAEQAHREIGAALKAPQRLEALAAYLGNAFAFLLPPKSKDDKVTAAGVVDRILAILLAVVPGGERLPLTRDDRGFDLGGTPGKMRATARIEPEAATAQKVTIAISGAAIKRAFLPPLFAAATGEGDFRLNAELTFRLSGQDELMVERVVIEAPHAFKLAASGRFRRGGEVEGAARPLRFDAVDATLQDLGGLSRILRVLAGVEGDSPSAYVRRLESAAQGEPLKRWLRGDTDAIRLEASGVIDGVPGPIKLTAATADAPEGVDNPAVSALWTEEAIRPPALHAGLNGLGEGSDERIPMTLKMLVSRIVAEDPSVAPYPESYNPPKAVRLARRARYYSAARGLPLTPNEAKIVSFRNRHRGERAFIIGNGPSLNLVDLTKLKGETTFGVNAIYLNQEKMGFLPTHHIVEDVFVAEDRAAEINALRGPHKWYGHYLRYCLKQTADVCWLNVACDYRNYPGFPHFSTNASRIVWVGGTVSYIALQLAYHMGFDEVILVGFDHSYSIPKEAKVEGRAITSTSDDPNHFHPGYFGKGYRWHDPRVDRMERAYENARRAYDAVGRKVINATVGGQLEVFERRDFTSLFR